MDKIIELAKKLSELSERGVGGEADNAKNMLHMLMVKHGISIEDIKGEAVKMVKFLVKKAAHRFFKQVFANVMGCAPSHYISGGKGFAHEITASQEIEIRAKFDFYHKKYIDDLEVFYTAFIIKNRLGRPLMDGESGGELSEKERKALMLASNMDRHQFRKQIESK